MTSQSGKEYDGVRELMQREFDAIPTNEPLFTTDATDLFELYLMSFPVAEMQFHNCNTCRHFIERFGGLVRIAADGSLISAVWPELELGNTYEPGVSSMRRAAQRAKVTGVFLSKEYMLGTPVTDHKGIWTHFGVRLPEARRYTGRILTAGQAMAAKSEDFKNVLRALQEFPPALVDKALTVLKSDVLYRAEKVLGAAQWLADLHAACEASNRANAVWRAVATAPDGFCHPRASMIGTLLEDLAAGKPFDVVAASLRSKMSPTAYQRPQAAPAAGAIKNAEALVEKLGIARSLERRLARLDEVEKLWVPVPKEKTTETGIFGAGDGRRLRARHEQPIAMEPRPSGQTQGRGGRQLQDRSLGLMIYPLGTYECPGQVPIVLTDNGDLGNGTHGPWVKYRFPWEQDEQAQPVLSLAFEQLIEIGYKRAESP
jgi:hypothetical protein